MPNLEEAEKAIHQAVTKSLVAHSDETGHRVGSKTSGLYVSSTKLMTFYYSNKARGSIAYEDGAILPNYKGIAVYDSNRLYLSIDCEHALCNAHLIRELKAILEREVVHLEMMEDSNLLPQ